jgi:hypothetical protein
LEALTGYYNAAYGLLRSALELVVKGAFWECLAHERFRGNTARLQLDKDKGKRKSVKDWVDELIEREPSVENDLEETSAAVFDKIAILFGDRAFQRQFVHIPSFRVIIQRLIEWQIIDFDSAFDVVYEGLYRNLSSDVHVVPDATDVGRKLLAERDFMEVEVIPQELWEYMNTLHRLIDIGIVIELNILKDWIEAGGSLRLKERLDMLENLELNYGVTKLKALTTL